MSDGSERLAELEARLNKLAEDTRAGLPERARALRGALETLDANEAAARDEIRRLAHMVRGSAGSHGMHELTEPARIVEVAASSATRADLASVARTLADQLDASARAAPLASPDAAPVAPPAPSGLRKPLEGKRVLAIDDDPATRRLLTVTLGNLGGASATVVDNARAFFEALEAGPHEAIIVDAMMPEMSGLECLERIAASTYARAEARYFVLSAASAEELRWTLPASLTIAWLRKPFRPRELIDAIHRAT